MKSSLRLSLLALSISLLASSADAQHDALFEEDAEKPPISRGAQAELDKLDEQPASNPADTWNGPRLEIGYEYFDLSDGRGGGSTHMAMFGGFLPMIPQLRAGLSIMGGIRDFSYEENDLFLGARAVVGYQHTDWKGVLPYVAGTLTGGVIIGERFASSVAYGLIGLGIEAGLDVRIVESFYTGLGVGYTRADMNGLAHDLLIIRLRVGL